MLVTLNQICTTEGVSLVPGAYAPDVNSKIVKSYFKILIKVLVFCMCEKVYEEKIYIVPWQKQQKMCALKIQFWSTQATMFDFSMEICTYIQNIDMCFRNIIFLQFSLGNKSEMPNIVLLSYVVVILSVGTIAYTVHIFVSPTLLVGDGQCPKTFLQPCSLREKV